MIRVQLPYHLQVLANVEREVLLEAPSPATQRLLLDALELRYPVLRGAIRDYGTLKRRALVRFFACGDDLSNEDMDAPLPEKVISGEEAYCIVGAIAGGCN